MPQPVPVMATRTRSSTRASTLPECATGPLPTAINVGYPSPEEEHEIIYRSGCYPAAGQVQILSTAPVAAAGD